MHLLYTLSVPFYMSSLQKSWILKKVVGVIMLSHMYLKSFLTIMVKRRVLLMLSVKGGASVVDEKKLPIEGSICIDVLTLDGEINVSKSLTLNEKVDVEYHIRDMTRITNV